eukprot:COSAG01_NODE_57227_length_313_cov_1.429907_1_plen_79_part_10
MRLRHCCFLQLSLDRRRYVGLLVGEKQVGFKREDCSILLIAKLEASMYGAMEAHAVYIHTRYTLPSRGQQFSYSYEVCL